MNVRRGGKEERCGCVMAEVRIGRGKGTISYWAAPVKAGQIIYEMGGGGVVTESLAKQAIEIAGSKMPVLTGTVVRDPNVKEIGIR
ncbi:putative ribosomal protein L16 [Helianthus anomalus]